jgi:hypothetical protein
MAATSVGVGNLLLVRADQLRWYRASPSAARGFCGRCGSILFWKMDDAETISITAGTIDGPTGLIIEGHIFCANKGDYYAIPEEGYRLEQWT